MSLVIGTSSAVTLPPVAASICRLSSSPAFIASRRSRLIVDCEVLAAAASCSSVQPVSIRYESMLTARIYAVPHQLVNTCPLW